MDQIATMKSLRVLYMIQNKISCIEGLETIAETLESVEFGGNKLRVGLCLLCPAIILLICLYKKIENLESCTRLTELWFGKNKITKLEGMATLKNLRILSIQSNRITKLEGLEELESLEELYISHNGIKKLEGLERNVCDAQKAQESKLIRMLCFVDKASRTRHRQQLHPGHRKCCASHSHGGILGASPTSQSSLVAPLIC